MEARCAFMSQHDSCIISSRRLKAARSLLFYVDTPRPGRHNGGQYPAEHFGAGERDAGDMGTWEQWVKASHGVAAIEAWLVHTIQGLGRLDAQLIARAARYARLTPAQRATEAEIVEFGDRLMLAYLWVLGVYEVVRTLDQRVRKEPEKYVWCKGIDITGAKKKLARLRMPLAKIEPADVHEETDSAIAYPRIRIATGEVEWQLGPDTFIGRMELSDIVLKMLEELRNVEGFKGVVMGGRQQKPDPAS